MIAHHDCNLNPGFDGCEPCASQPSLYQSHQFSRARQWCQDLITNYFTIIIINYRQVVELRFPTQNEEQPGSLAGVHNSTISLWVKQELSTPKSGDQFYYRHFI